MNKPMNNFSMQTGESTLVLAKAILLYAVQKRGHLGGGHQNITYATVHDVENFGTEARPSFQIAAGRAVTKEAVVKMFGNLAKKLTLTVDLLPENVLSISADHMVWWTPACERGVFFKNKELGTRSAKVPHPPLLFVVVKGSWSIFSLADNERPKVDTALHHAPYFNVYDNGAICTGSAATPKGIASNAIPQWEAAFFESEFTHINGQKKKASHPRGEYALWKELLDGVYQTFPSEYLVKANQTLGSLMMDIRKNLEGTN
ncbi:PRTRC system protein B [Pseudoduganella sp. R-34]|uniref:PRTRC system protein B n=1 Tax=Pseudoduganella sp. R-34 TaxID=3404062 RepID=UPI003CF641CF